MEYIKVPYSRLKGKKYGGELTPKESELISQYVYSTNLQEPSNIYGGSFQGLYKTYKSGEDPAISAPSVFTGGIINPNNMISVHNAISSIAKKYGYDSPSESDLTGIVNIDLFQKISTPNTYFIAKSQYEENFLIVTDEDSNPTYLGLPTDIEYTSFFSVDENGNILIPKEDYEEDLEAM